MQRERVADDIYVFTSDLYAQVTASAIVTSEGVVLVDTLVYPSETLAIRSFIESRLGKKVIYVINTHFHADHSTGTCFFEGAKVVGHALCRDLLDQRGREGLAQAKQLSDEMRDVEIVLPEIVFETGELKLHVGNKTIKLWHTPGHSPDTIACVVLEDRIMIASDTLMPIPHFVDGAYDDLVASLTRLRGSNFENIVQGHGEVILRGEIEEKIESDLTYMRLLSEAVDAAIAANTPLEAIDVENCGKSRVLLNGSVQQLHSENVMALAQQRREPVEQV